MNQPDTSTAEPTPTSGPDTGRRSDWVRLVLGIAFVLTVLVAFSYVMSERTPADADSGAFEFAFADGFERPADPRSLNGGDVDDWSTLGGTWATELGVAYLADAHPKVSMAVVEIESTSMSVTASVSGSNPCGVVAGTADADTYIALVRAPDYGVWNIKVVDDGEATTIGKLPDVGNGDIANKGVAVTLSVGEEAVTATVGLRSANFVGHGITTGRFGGLIAEGAGSTCVWDDVRLRTAR